MINVNMILSRMLSLTTLLCGSFFDEQDGDFALDLSAIATYKDVSTPGRHPDTDAEDDGINLKAHRSTRQEKKAQWRTLLCGLI